MQIADIVSTLNRFLFLVLISEIIEKIRSASALEWGREKTASTNNSKFIKILSPLKSLCYVIFFHILFISNKANCSFSILLKTDGRILHSNANFVKSICSIRVAT